MPAVILNTASYEDFTALDGIGQHRATAILKLREEKGFLTEEDIKQSLQGTYGTIKWGNSFSGHPTIFTSGVEEGMGRQTWKNVKWF